MSSRGATAIAMTLVLLLVQSAQAQSAVELGRLHSLGEGDLGIEGASISPDGELVIVHGKESAIFAVNSSSPEEFSKIEWNYSRDLVDSGFHPNGQTALIVGDSGAVLRYMREQNVVEEAVDDILLGQTNLNAVSWKGDGSWAYVGGEGGW